MSKDETNVNNDWYWEVIDPYHVRHYKQIEDVEFEDIQCKTKALIIYEYDKERETSHS